MLPSIIKFQSRICRSESQSFSASHCLRVSLEIQLQTELENSGRIGIRRGDLAERRAVQRSRGARQVGMVQAVEAL